MGHAARVLSLLCATLLLSWSAPAAAARRPPEAPDDARTRDARVHLRAGIIYFQSARYREAAEQMTEAYRLRPVPELQYNLAQCYERLGELSRAVEAYETYLARLPQAQDRAAVERRVRELKDLRERAAAPAKDAAAPAPEPPPAPLAPQEKVVFKEIVVYKEQPPRAGRGARLAAGALTGLAAVGLAGGIGFLIARGQIERDIQAQGGGGPLGFDPAELGPDGRDRCMTLNESTAGMPMMGMTPTVDDIKAAGQREVCAYYRINRESQRAALGAAIVGYGIFGAAGVTALGLYLYSRRLDRRQDEELRRQGGQLSLLPTVGPGGGGAVLSGTF